MFLLCLRMFETLCFFFSGFLRRVPDPIEESACNEITMNP